MAITYSISREDTLINAFATGIIRADDLHGLIQSILADPGFRPGLRGLFDARYAEPDITVMQVAEVAGKAIELQKRGLERLAIVAESQTTYRVAKTFSVIARAFGIDVETFREMSLAQVWLDS